METNVIYDDQQSLQTRFISFIGEHDRYDLCCIYSDRFFGKTLVLNMLSNQFAIIGRDDLDEEGFLQTAFRISPEAASELRDLIAEII